MALPYFYEPDLKPGAAVFTLGGETSRHCVQVLRMKTGARLNLTDGQGHVFGADILSADKRHAEVKILEERYVAPLPRKLTIGISLLKNPGRFEWFLEKATEIGAAGIIPLVCQRTERQHFRHDRMNGILVAAMIQSQQAWLPGLQEPQKAEGVMASSHACKLIAHCEDGKKNELNNLDLPGDILMLIGPEGDFTAAEIGTALENNFLPVSLGPTRLRTETAGIVAATLIMNL